MIVLVCGSRDWADTAAIEQELRRYPPGTVVIHGDNGYDANGKALWGRPDESAVRGADKLAGAIAQRLGFEVRRFTPNWAEGRGAGPKRNSRMLKEGQPDECLAFTPDLTTSRGTADMVRKAQGAGVKVKVVGGSA